MRGLEAGWNKRDGSVLFVRESARAVRRADGRVRYYDGIVEDFTQRKRAEDTLRESEERFRAIFHQAAVGVAQANAEGEVITMNDRYCDILSYTREELLGTKLSDKTPADDYAAVLATKGAHGWRDPVLFQGYSVRSQRQRCHLVSLYESLVREGSRPKYFVTVVADITKRGMSEFSYLHLGHCAGLSSTRLNPSVAAPLARAE